MRTTIPLASVLLLALSLCGLAQVTQPRALTATIAANASVSSAVALGGCTPAGILIPAQWTAAGLAIQASIDDETYANVYDVYGTRVWIPAAASYWIVLEPSDTWGFRHLKVVSTDSAFAAVNQTAARSVAIVCR